MLRPPGTGADEFQLDDGPENRVVEVDMEQMSLFSVVASTATDITMHTVGEDGKHLDGIDFEMNFSREDLGMVAYDAEPDPPERFFSDDPALGLDLPEIPTAAGLIPLGSMSVAETKNDLRTRNAHVAKRLVDITGWDHSKVQGEMNRLAGVNRGGGCHERTTESALALCRELASPPPAHLTSSTLITPRPLRIPQQRSSRDQNCGENVLWRRLSFSFMAGGGRATEYEMRGRGDQAAGDG